MPELFRLLSEKIITLLKRIPRHFILPIIIFTLGLTFFIFGLMQYVLSSVSREKSQTDNFTKSKEISQLQNNDFTPSVITPEIKMISIDIEGAVQNPGLYSVSSASHLQDGLIASGGLSANADRDWISKNLNLAENLTDGIKIYIPRIGEQVAGFQIADSNSNSLQNSGINPSGVSGTDNAQVLLEGSPSLTLRVLEGQDSFQVDAGAKSTSKKKKTRKTSARKTKKQNKTQQDTLGVSTARVNINTASAEELSILPGVKAKTAGKIISRRPYASLDDLLKKKAVTKRTFEKIKDRITL